MRWPAGPPPLLSSAWLRLLAGIAGAAAALLVAPPRATSAAAASASPPGDVAPTAPVHVGPIASARHALATPPAPIPHFARKYGVPCTQCHVLPPKLNAFGEAFVANNYRMPGLRSGPTPPLAVWLSARADRPAASPDGSERVVGYLNRVEVISGGRVVAPWLSYFVEWRALSLETRADRSLRDRSGRFEDLFVTAQGEHVEASLGQFRQLAQVDVSRRLGLSEPAVFSTSLAGSGGGTPRARSLRGFSPAGRAPTVRAGWIQPLDAGWRWTTYASVAFPGELSLPLTREARREASNELEAEPKGVFVESFARRGLASVGGHVFYDSPDRYLAGLVATGARGPLHVAGAGALGRAGGGPALGRWHVEGEYFPWPQGGVGARVEDLAGLPPALVTYGNVHFPGTLWTVRLTVEQRVQRGRSATLLELGTVF